MPSVIGRQSCSQTTMHGNNNEQNCGIIGDSSINVLGNNSTIHIQSNPKLATDELDELFGNKVSHNASNHSFHPECHPGTRSTPLEAVDAWIDSSTASPILWLYGPAGVGKSVIAKTICDRPRQVKKIVAIFFFSASSDKSAAVLPPTLAQQLAHNVPDTKPYIIDALKDNPSPFQCRIEDQIRRLILEPLKACDTLFSKPIILIDGADECTDERGLTDLLRFLERSANSEELPVRFIICSRPEPRIRVVLMKKYDSDDCTNGADQRLEKAHPRVSSTSHALGLDDLKACLYNLKGYLYGLKGRRYDLKGFLNSNLESFGQFYQDLNYIYRTSQSRDKTDSKINDPDPSGDMHTLFNHPIVSRIQIGESKDSEEDIKTYLTAKVELHNQSAESRSAINVLVDNACGQFLYASTIVRLLENGWTTAEVVKLARSNRSLSDLDNLYTGVLLKATQDATTAEALILKDTFSILVVFAENTRFANIKENFLIIERLLDLGKDILYPRLSKLHSVLKIERGISITVYHRSFLELLQDPNRSKEYAVSYPLALRRFLALFGKAIFRFASRRLCGNLRYDDRRTLLKLETMENSFLSGFFAGSRSQDHLFYFHTFMHMTLFVLSLLCFVRCASPIKSLIVPAVASLPVFSFVLRLLVFSLFTSLHCYLLFAFLLICYTSSVNDYTSRPFFHPFFHPFFFSLTVIGHDQWTSIVCCVMFLTCWPWVVILLSI